MVVIKVKLKHCCLLSLEDVVGRRIRKYVKVLERSFMGVTVLTYQKIKEHGYDIGRVRARLHSCTLQVKDEHRPFFQRLEREIDSTTLTIDILWEKLCNYWNFLNYTLLENLTRRIGDDVLTKAMEEYAEQLRVFRSNTRVVDFLKHCPVIPERLEEVDERWRPFGGQIVFALADFLEEFSV